MPQPKPLQNLELWKIHKKSQKISTRFPRNPLRTNYGESLLPLRKEKSLFNNTHVFPSSVILYLFFLPFSLLSFFPSVLSHSIELLGACRLLLVFKLEKAVSVNQKKTHIIFFNLLITRSQPPSKVRLDKHTDVIGINYLLTKIEEHHRQTSRHYINLRSNRSFQPQASEFLDQKLFVHFI